jgi:sigma-B regulation protein RsbU (phosphoserine phosphatase)
MTDGATGVLEALGKLIDGAHLAPPHQIPSVIDAALASAGWRATVYLADFDQRTLRPIGDGSQPESIDGTLAGRCFRHSEPVHARRPVPHTWVPLIDGVDRLGVLRFQLPSELDMADTVVAAHVRWVAHLIGHLVATKSAYSDFFDATRLNRERTTSAELVWSMIPPLTVAAEGIAIAGGLEPSHSVAGDVFDYAIDEEVAHLAIVDATGHDLGAALIAAIVLAAYRSERRRHAGLPTTVARIDQTLEASAPDTYASAIFAELDMRSGMFTYTVTGHPAPLLMRNGKIVKSLNRGRRILLGFPGHEVPVATEPLEPGDWIVLYTDGVVEARDADGRMFGLPRLINLIQRCAADRRSAAESMRRIIHRVLEHQQGVLQDDATIVLVQWMTTLEEQLEAT